MMRSQYFERTLFYDRSLGSDEYYENTSEQIFEKDVRKTRIEVCLQSCSSAAQFRTVTGGKNLSSHSDHKGLKEQEASEPIARPGDCIKPELNGTLAANGDCHLISEARGLSESEHNEASDTDDSCSVLSQASSTALLSAVDQRQGESGPPLYPGLPKLTVDNLEPEDIENFVQRTKNNFRVFYLRQLHSHSRLQITKEVFERLLKSCHVFPRFSEYVIGFGRKSSETEVGPPSFKYRSICTARGNMYRGFGMS
jgi:hypothetical protein